MSSGSGIKIADDIKVAYNHTHMKPKKDEEGSKLRYVIIKFNEKNDGLELVDRNEGVEQEGVKSYVDVISSLPDNDVRYVFYDFPFLTKASDAKSSKVICVSWHPQGSTVKRRMICASTFTALKTACKIQANEAVEGDDASDVDVDTILKKIGGKSAILDTYA